MKVLFQYAKLLAYHICLLAIKYKFKDCLLNSLGLRVNHQTIPQMETEDANDTTNKIARHLFVNRRLNSPLFRILLFLPSICYRLIGHFSAAKRPLNAAVCFALNAEGGGRLPTLPPPGIPHLTSRRKKGGGPRKGSKELVRM